ncbi:secreted RxLR effector protein 161-like [Schistocerca americana]|uniref:secreted RxLR effector protein 161-like n=1 Tax=Schistocerca americana TaxID=7009 RepID=UPI001F4F4065|nr:secreted RxLR effector protein 161-like [Schistocerca americana]
MKTVPFREAIDSIGILNCTKPDIAYSIGVGTKDFKLKFSKDEGHDSIGYIDADWAGDTADRKSTTSFLFTSQGAADLSKTSRYKDRTNTFTPSEKKIDSEEITMEQISMRGMLTYMTTKILSRTRHHQLIQWIWTTKLKY